MKNSLEKKSQTQVSGNGEIGIIRNILMGEHIAHFESNVKSLRELIENNDLNSNDQRKKMETSINQRLTELEKNTTDWFDSFEKSMNARLDKMELSFNQKMGEIENKFEVDKSEDRESISEMLATLSKTIAGKK